MPLGTAPLAVLLAPKNSQAVSDTHCSQAAPLETHRRNGALLVGVPVAIVYNFVLDRFIQGLTSTGRQ